MKDHASLSAPGMTILAGADAEHAADESYTDQKYVTIYKSYDLWIGGEEVTSLHLYGVGNDTAAPGRWTFTPANAEAGTHYHTLTLNGYHYDGPGHLDSSYYGTLYNYAALSYGSAEDLVIELVGDNSLTRRGGERSYGMLFSNGQSAITIQSATRGTLTVNAVGDPEENKDRFGIIVYGHFCITGAEVTVNAAATGNQADSIAVSYGSVLRINDGSLKAFGGDSERASIGIKNSSSGASLTVENGGFLLGAAGKAAYSYGLDSPIKVSGDSTLIAYTTADDTATVKCAILSKDDDITVGDGLVRFAGDDAGSALVVDSVVGKKYVRISAPLLVTLDANGGRIDGAETKTVGVAPHTYAYIAALDAEPVRAGYTLTGWALDAAGEQPLEDSYTVEGDTTLYALWQQRSSTYSGDSRPPAPKAAETAHGKVTFDPKNPAKNENVTVTVTPDEGYELDSITAKDSDGKDVPLTKNAGGTYTFTQGEKQVTVTAVFAEKPADDPLAAFTDLDADAWYASDIRWALTEGVMDGMGGGVFAPGGAVSRAMVAQVLWKLEGSPVVNYALPFSDVGSGAWYTEAVRWAASAQLVQGYEDGTFRPEQNVTRQELATVLYRWARTKGLGYDGDLWAFRLDFTDAAEVADWADEAVHWMVQEGILNGRGEGLLAPGGTATRAELAAILHRLDGLTTA